MSGTKADLPRRPWLAGALAMALGAGMITAGVIASEDGGGTPPPVGSGGDIRLVAYDSCDTALAELKNRIMPHVGPFGLDLSGGRMFTDSRVEDGAAAEGKAAAPAEAPMAAEQSQPEEHSTTNVHEAGVDEPDLVKTDGKRVVSITDGVLRVVDVASRKQTAVVRLDGENGGHPNQLLLAGDRALVMASSPMAYGGRAMPEIAPGEATPDPVPDDSMPMPLESQLVLVDLTGAGAILGRLAVDGFYLDARQIGSVARVVLRSSPRLEFRYPEFANSDPNVTIAANKEIVANSAIQDWLPRYELTTGDGVRTSGQLTDCANLSHPIDYSAASMLTVLTVDLTRELGTGDPVSIVADGNTVYGTDKSLYVANGHVMDGTPDGQPMSIRTELYQFDITGADKPVHVASGAVEGSLLNQYSLSEFDGHLRVATTSSGGNDSESMITVLTRNGNQLTMVGNVSGLGVGERIYAVRYFGDTAYVVTFRQTDPLYTVDLSDPAAPKVTGELKITGYSAYLHPAGDGRLLGVGQEADKDGRATGAQVSLFDTTNRSGATRIAQYHLQYAWTEVESDPHAFLYWPDKGLVFLPILGGFAAEPGGKPDQGGGMLVLRLKDNSFEQVATISHGQNVVPQRALVIGNELWTVSQTGMMANDLDSLSQLAWVPFS